LYEVTNKPCFAKGEVANPRPRGGCRGRKIWTPLFWDSIDHVHSIKTKQNHKSLQALFAHGITHHFRLLQWWKSYYFHSTSWVKRLTSTL